MPSVARFWPSITTKALARWRRGEKDESWVVLPVLWIPAFAGMTAAGLEPAAFSQFFEGGELFVVTEWLGGVFLQGFGCWNSQAFAA